MLDDQSKIFDEVVAFNENLVVLDHATRYIEESTDVFVIMSQNVE